MEDFNKNCQEIYCIFSFAYGVFSDRLFFMQTAILSSADQPSLLRGITLINFRNYTHHSFEFCSSMVAISGDNGAGKTNILEAISLFSPGRGLKSAKLGEMKNIQSQSPWVVSADFSFNGTSIPFGTTMDYSASGAERRQIRINQTPTKSQSTLSEWLNIVWVIPAMARLFQESGSIRRKFIDRMVMALNPSHTERINRYEHYLRERSQLLRQGMNEDQWLSSIEQRLSEDGVAIAIARSQLVRQLTQSQSNDPASPFPRFFAQMDGTLDQWCRETTAIDAEEKMRQLLRESRKQDTISGGASLGAHRSDLTVTHLGKHMPGDLCSTGEQKMLLHALTLSFIRLLDCHRDRFTLLLLDDVVAHLDQDHRNYLFQEIRSILLNGANIQLFMTGTTPDDFSGINQLKILEI